MIISRKSSRVTASTASSPAAAEGAAAAATKSGPRLEKFIQARDYTGAQTLLEFNLGSGGEDATQSLWLAYTVFHLGLYERAREIYAGILQLEAPNTESVHIYLAICYFFLGLYKEAEAEALKGPPCKLLTRLQFHLAHTAGDEQKVMEKHQQLQDTLEDQLSLASVHYLRQHYQEAIDVYKHILLEHKEAVALNVYVAMCYYKLEYFDMSQELLAMYLQHDPTSFTAINLKACNFFKLYNSQAAEQELSNFTGKASHDYAFGRDLLKHNLVVFRGGQGALTVLPGLVDVIPEAKYNLALYYLKQKDVDAAFQLVHDHEPTNSQEYILKAVVLVHYGQLHASQQHLLDARDYFQFVGTSQADCDTILGRQAMASALSLVRKYDESLVYFNSIRAYLTSDDAFNYNYAQALAQQGDFVTAEECLITVQNEDYQQEYMYISHLARCFIMNKKPRLAWEIYLRMDTSSESYLLLHLIAEDCYKTRQFLFAAKAFDVLERLDPTPDYWEGKRGACVGLFQQIVSGDESSELIHAVVGMLKTSMHPQVEQILYVVRRWASRNRIPLEQE